MSVLAKNKVKAVHPDEVPDIYDATDKVHDGDIMIAGSDVIRAEIIVRLEKEIEECDDEIVKRALARRVEDFRSGKTPVNSKRYKRNGPGFHVFTDDEKLYMEISDYLSDRLFISDLTPKDITDKWDKISEEEVITEFKRVAGDHYPKWLKNKKWESALTNNFDEALFERLSR